MYLKGRAQHRLSRVFVVAPQGHEPNTVKEGFNVPHFLSYCNHLSWGGGKGYSLLWTIQERYGRRFSYKVLIKGDMQNLVKVRARENRKFIALISFTELRITIFLSLSLWPSSPRVSPCSSVARASDRCLEGHMFNSRRGLRFAPRSGRHKITFRYF